MPHPEIVETFASMPQVHEGTTGTYRRSRASPAPFVSNPNAVSPVNESILDPRNGHCQPGYPPVSGAMTEPNGVAWRTNQQMNHQNVTRAMLVPTETTWNANQLGNQVRNMKGGLVAATDNVGDVTGAGSTNQVEIPSQNGLMITPGETTGNAGPPCFGLVEPVMLGDPANYLHIDYPKLSDYRYKFQCQWFPPQEPGSSNNVATRRHRPQGLVSQQEPIPQQVFGQQNEPILLQESALQQVGVAQRSILQEQGNQRRGLVHQDAPPQQEHVQMQQYGQIDQQQQLAHIKQYGQIEQYQQQAQMRQYGQIEQQMTFGSGGTIQQFGPTQQQCLVQGQANFMQHIPRQAQISSEHVATENQVVAQHHYVVDQAGDIQDQQLVIHNHAVVLETTKFRSKFGMPGEIRVVQSRTTSGEVSVVKVEMAAEDILAEKICSPKAGGVLFTEKTCNFVGVPEPVHIREDPTLPYPVKFPTDTVVIPIHRLPGIENFKYPFPEDGPRRIMLRRPPPEKYAPAANAAAFFDECSSISTTSGTDRGARARRRARGATTAHAGPAVCKRRATTSKKNSANGKRNIAKTAKQVGFAKALRIAPRFTSSSTSQVSPPLSRKKISRRRSSSAANKKPIGEAVKGKTGVFPDGGVRKVINRRRDARKPRHTRAHEPNFPCPRPAYRTRFVDLDQRPHRCDKCGFRFHQKGGTSEHFNPPSCFRCGSRVVSED